MKALRIEQIGQPLREANVACPEPGIGEVLLRVAAAGICHSDVHYRNGTSSLRGLPLVPGHEVAGIVEKLGPGVEEPAVGQRVCVHYLKSCGRCYYCSIGQEQFCAAGSMIGKDCDGGYEEFVSVPARNTFIVPNSIPLSQAAVMMCSSSTAYHALRQARLQPRETVAVFGLGGLGMSAVQLAAVFAPRTVVAVDIDPAKLELAESFGALPVNAAESDPVRAIMELTGRRGVDVAVELIGLPSTMRQAVESLSVFGRAALAGISDQSFEVATYRQLIGKEASIVGVSDHLASEIPTLLELAEAGSLDLGRIVARSVALEAGAVNEVLDHLEGFSSPVRTVIQFPQGGK